MPTLFPPKEWPRSILDVEGNCDVVIPSICQDGA
jgi:hypothetical protein